MTHTTSKQDLFVTLVATVNYCHKEIYYRYYKGPRYASETSYYKKFENEELQDNVKSNKNLAKQFSWGAFFLGGIFPGGIFPEGNFLGAIFPLTYKVYIDLIRNTYSKQLFMDFKVWLYRVEGSRYLKLLKLLYY